MPRTWDKQSLAEFNQKRDVQRRQNGEPPWESLSHDDKQKANDALKGSLKAAETARLKTQAWPLEKYPIGNKIAPRSGSILLPKDYGARSGYDRVRYSPRYAVSIAVLCTASGQILHRPKPEPRHLRLLLHPSSASASCDGQLPFSRRSFAEKVGILSIFGLIDFLTSKHPQTRVYGS